MKVSLRATLVLCVAILAAGVFIVKPAHAVTDWSIFPNQTTQCYYFFQAYKTCEQIYADVQLDSVDNAQADYYQVILRAYDLNSTSNSGDTCFMAVCDYDAYISFSAPNPGGIIAEKPQSQYTIGQTIATLTYAGLSVPLLTGGYQTDYTATVPSGSGTEIAHWHVYSGALCIYNCEVFANYAEQGIDVAVPKGQTWTFNFHYHDNDVYFCTLNSGKFCYFDITGSITVDPSNVIFIEPSPLLEGCSVYSTTHSCATYIYSVSGPGPATSVDLNLADSNQETWSLTASCPTGWTCSLQYSSVSVGSGQMIQDQLYIGVQSYEISSQYSGWYQVNVTGSSGAGQQTAIVPIDLVVSVISGGGGGGGGGGCGKTNGICPM